MPQENQSQLFIRLLKDARRTDRVLDQIKRSVRSRAYAKRFKEMFMSDQPRGGSAALPMDCVQMMNDPAGQTTRNQAHSASHATKGIHHDNPDF